ncbi:6-phosphogluconolactonase, partial [candidate division KSB1 bacterium]|nr:6-phosphogluconolactonase [candidate division KSB1 bacterium]
VATHPQTGQKRVSLTMPVLNAATRVSFLVSGNGKAHIVSDILNKRRPELPAAQVIPENGVEWFLDAEAAALL